MHNFAYMTEKADAFQRTMQFVAHVCVFFAVDAEASVWPSG